MGSKSSWWLSLLPPLVSSSWCPFLSLISGSGVLVHPNRCSAGSFMGYQSLSYKVIFLSVPSSWENGFLRDSESTLRKEKLQTWALGKHRSYIVIYHQGTENSITKKSNILKNLYLLLIKITKIYQSTKKSCNIST